MTIEKAIRILVVEYEKAKKVERIRKPLAFALYQVWKKADREKGEVNT